MTLVLVEVPDEAAIEALRQQKNIQVVGIVTPPVVPAPRKWAGALAAINPDAATAWDKHLQEIRNEWE